MRRETDQLPDELDPGHEVGPWIVERILGHGGMSTVYGVVHAQFGKRAALKLARPGVFGRRFTEDRFLLEARVVNAIGHPDVIDIFDTGVIAGRPYLVMEQLEGETLGERLERGPIPIGEICRILVRVCDVLAAAHRVGVIHRDLKLDNVFLLSDDRGIKVIDWGLANFPGEDPLRDLIAGTPHYVAPEQVRGDEVTPRSDIYSLGVLAYVLFLGKAPFDCDSSSLILSQHVRELPPPPRLQWPDIPVEIERLLIGMLAKTPARRPAIEEIVATLEAARRPYRRVSTRKRTRPPVQAVGSPPPDERPTFVVDPFGRVVELPTWTRKWWLGATVAFGLVAGGVAWRLATGL